MRTFRTEETLLGLVVKDTTLMVAFTSRSRFQSRFDEGEMTIHSARFLQNRAQSTLELKIVWFEISCV